MKKVALITGITGQDDAYLAELLLKKGYTVQPGQTEKGGLIPLDRLRFKRIMKAAKEQEPSGMFGIYRLNGKTCQITEIVVHERANIPASDLLHAYPEDIIPNKALSDYCRSTIIKVHESGRPLSITVTIASSDGQTYNRHIHLEKGPNASTIATVGWPD